MPGVYGSSYESALRVVAREFNVTIEFAKSCLAELKGEVGRWVKFAGRRLFAGRTKGGQRPKSASRPSRKEMCQHARLDNFPVYPEYLPHSWREFAGAKSDDPGLKRACGLM